MTGSQILTEVVLDERGAIPPNHSYEVGIPLISVESCNGFGTSAALGRGSPRVLLSLSKCVF